MADDVLQPMIMMEEMEQEDGRLEDDKLWASVSLAAMERYRRTTWSPITSSGWLDR